MPKRRRSSCIGTYGRLLMKRRSCGAVQPLDVGWAGRGRRAGRRGPSPRRLVGGPGGRSLAPLERLGLARRRRRADVLVGDRRPSMALGAMRSPGRTVGRARAAGARSGRAEPARGGPAAASAVALGRGVGHRAAPAGTGRARGVADGPDGPSCRVRRGAGRGAAVRGGAGSSGGPRWPGHRAAFGDAGSPRIGGHRVLVVGRRHRSGPPWSGADDTAGGPARRPRAAASAVDDVQLAGRLVEHDRPVGAAHDDVLDARPVAARAGRSRARR